MEPKEKAIELVNKYLQIYDGKVEIAKQCAIIAVDELIELSYSSILISTIRYFKEVKQEIENL